MNFVAWNGHGKEGTSSHGNGNSIIGGEWYLEGAGLFERLMISAYG